MAYTKHKLYNRARYSYYDQKKRCENKQCKEYVWYGEKGISVDYELKDFLEWYYINAEGFKRPTVDRVDHGKNYCFGNIQIVEKSENSKERIRRLGTPLERKPVIAIKNGIFVGEYDSAYHAAEALDCIVSNVRKVACGERFTHHGYIFKYKE
jgi:hypothetical protein